ncbi:hypothetical protein ABZ929_03580 [Streptomyces physcomitrii]|uniref:alpha/beta hydrolase n=1 Tax=Streptomyces physcomitrii TaxID=2724184 RepID=UPI0033C4E095
MPSRPVRVRCSGTYRGAEPSSAVAERSPGAVQRSPAAAQGEAHAGAEERLRLPRPTGPFRVGAETLHLTDHSRRDPWVPEAGDRELMVSLSYPARGGGAGRERPYLTGVEARLLVEFPERPGVDPARVAATRTHARTGARPAPGRFPLVLLSPGFTLPRATLTSLAEDLASRGYVVAAIDHAYESSGTAFPGGRTLTCVACERTDPETGDTPPRRLPHPAQEVGTAAAARRGRPRRTRRCGSTGPTGPTGPAGPEGVRAPQRRRRVQCRKERGARRRCSPGRPGGIRAVPRALRTAGAGDDSPAVPGAHPADPGEPRGRGRRAPLARQSRAPGR